MQIITEIADLRIALQSVRRADQTIGLVPTMGAFHEGHLSLMRRAKAENDLTVVTLFINPTQFNDPEDFKKYPRDTDHDARMAESVGVDYLFLPPPEAVYPPGFDTVVTVRALSEQLEGASRPGHFNGVATVVAKLLNIAGADRAYFGEKDWQQLQIVKALTRDLDIPTQIIGLPIVRELDGLALSSRNVRLSPEERIAALVLDRALDNAQALVRGGIQDTAALAAEMRRAISSEPLAHLDYAILVHPETLTEVASLEHGAIALIAANFGKVRLIDNRLFSPPAPNSGATAPGGGAGLGNAVGELSTPTPPELGAGGSLPYGVFAAPIA
jgi:pantoate--beta-alanine ligase